MPYGTVNADAIVDSNGAVFSPSSSLFKNRIINGDMRIDQLNAGASVTPVNNQYLVDRWQVGIAQSSKFTAQQNAASVTPPVGFTNYLGITSSSAYSVLTGDYFFIQQAIEGLNISDLAWGTANAASITLSFWVRSSLTGTFAGALRNSAGNRSYPFTYTINAANTWEKETITIAGDTSGTWLTTNGAGIQLALNLGTGTTLSGTAGAWAAANYVSATGATSVVGTSGATFYITGVQLEKGSTATSFDYRPYGTELSLCQRYYQAITLVSSANNIAGFATSAAVPVSNQILYSVTPRAQPTITLPSSGQTSGTISFVTSVGGYPATTGVMAVNYAGTSGFCITASGYSGLNSGAPSFIYSNGSTTIAISSEL